MMSTWCSKHVQAWNKLIVKQNILCIKLVNYRDKYININFYCIENTLHPLYKDQSLILCRTPNCCFWRQSYKKKKLQRYQNVWYLKIKQIMSGVPVCFKWLSWRHVGKADGTVTRHDYSRIKTWCEVRWWLSVQQRGFNVSNQASTHRPT